MDVRQRTSVVIIEKDRVLGFRAEDPASGVNYIFLPGGLIEPGETAEAAAVRETQEETGYSIELIDTESIDRSYLFEWDGELRNCATRFFLGQLTSEMPATVSDATYHRGVIWVPLDEISFAFGYHPEILEPVLLLMQRFALLQASDQI